MRFFRLVRAADCLTACLLHRYFGQVRSHALIALSHAFSGHPRLEVSVCYFRYSLYNVALIYGVVTDIDLYQHVSF